MMDKQSVIERLNELSKTHFILFENDFNPSWFRVNQEYNLEENDNELKIENTLSRSFVKYATLIEKPKQIRFTLYQPIYSKVSHFKK
jgi:hypothetical protein